MRIIAKKTLKDYWIKNNSVKDQLSTWYYEAEKANWKSPNEIVLEYPSASILKDNRICFIIKGNKYRLIVKINYDYQVIWIRFIGTHAEYDKINANNI